MACGCEQEVVIAMATTIQRGTRLLAEVDLGGIGVAAGEEFDVDECNEHFDYDLLLATGAVTRVKLARVEVTKLPDTTKPEAVKLSAGGEGGR